MDDYKIVAQMAAQLLAAYKAASSPKVSHEEQVATAARDAWALYEEVRAQAANRFEPARRA